MQWNERLTENIINGWLNKVGITEKDGFSVEQQLSSNPRIEKLLKNASKSGNGVGKPEFIITKNTEQNFILIIECKADPKFHESKNHDKYKDYAVDGVLLYASYLAKEFNVIAVAVSGQKEAEIKIDTFLHPRGSLRAAPLKEGARGTAIREIISWTDYIRHATYDENLTRVRREDLARFSRDLHNYMRDYAKITEADKPLLVSGILIALMDDGFKVSYSKYEEGSLAKRTYETVRDIINSAQLGINQEEKKDAIINSFSFIKHHPELKKIDPETKESPLAHIIKEIDLEVRPFTEDHYDFDVIGSFYAEFVRYTGGDKKGLGIVLTPKHLTDLFADLAGVNKNSTILDTCAGTGGFLISAMQKMTKNVSDLERKRILSDSLIGIEQEPKMFALAVSNMILRGDGKTNLYQGSCFDEDIIGPLRGKATVGFINPPYSQKGKALHEWNFIETLLDSLQENATGIVVVPMSLSIAPHPTRQKILINHRLEAVMSMPDDLFYPVGVVSCIMVFTAHKPHDSEPRHESWFGYWKDDGFIKDRLQGRIPTSRWPLIREKWLNTFSKREVIPGFSVRKKVDGNDEWCAEAYLETDYSSIKEEDFEDLIKRYILFKTLSNR
ncbi:SAM-dependent methyltransferase [Candidatus Parcubacteria bacterium]|nr:SAM-dependent methyltransferase [Candidatus Parcubacteria bacterium]